MYIIFFITPSKILEIVKGKFFWPLLKTVRRLYSRDHCKAVLQQGIELGLHSGWGSILNTTRKSGDLQPRSRAGGSGWKISKRNIKAKGILAKAT